MRKLAILALIVSTPVAYAQQPPSNDALVAEYYIETGQLRVALGNQMKKTLEAQAEIARLREEAKAKESKPE